MINRTSRGIGAGARVWLVTAVVMAGVTPSPNSRAGSVDAQDAVKRADDIRGPGRPFTMKMALTDRKGEQVISETGVMVNFHDTERTLIEYFRPKKDEGRKILRNGENMWIRIPSSKRAIRITPQQRLLGQVSNGDILSTNYANDYNATYLGNEAITEPDGESHDCLKLELVKKTNAATYFRLIYYVETGSYKPVRSEFFTQTGKLLKVAHFLGYGQALGTKRPQKIVIVNAVEHEENSVIEILEYGESSLPVSYYSDSALNQ